jgi:lycopene beta-cyclase
MSERECDIAIVGGGLAGGLIALALAERRPDVEVRLFEAASALGAGRRWSWFSSDLSDDGRALVRPLPSTRWNKGYDVRFPGHSRQLEARYRSLAGADFAAALEQRLPPGTIRLNSRVSAFDAAGVTLDGGERIAARAVIDCRGFAPTAHLTGGWQVFLGRHVRTARPHGVRRPLIMDATVGQSGRFRFEYVLPLADRELLVEDTYYQLEGVLDEAAMKRRLNRYIGKKHWDCEEIGVEQGALPVICGGDFEAWQAERRVAGVARAGAHAGFLHPLTGYTMPFAVETALAVANSADLPGPEMATMLEERARAHWQATRFHRRLATMLFGAAQPSRRWKLFARFYRLDEELIERFFAAQTTRGDRLRILCGKPPVSPLRAVRAVLTSRPTLEPEA